MEQAWGNEFANPLVEKRRAVDSGNATVSELQIFYLQRIPTPGSRVRASFSTMSTRRIANCWTSGGTTTKTPRPGRFWLRWSVPCSRSAWASSSPTGRHRNHGPLTRLIHVAEQIGQSGDLEHNIDVHGKDEIGTWLGRSTRWSST